MLSRRLTKRGYDVSITMWVSVKVRSAAADLGDPSRGGCPDASINAELTVTAERRVLEEAISGRSLVAGQAEAMRHLAELDGRLVALVGPGGSGKTYSIGVYVDAVETNGHSVIGVATSGAAARMMSEDLGEPWTGTIAMLRHHVDA